MTDAKNLLQPVELTDSELDAVAGAVNQRARDGLVIAQVGVNISDNAVAIGIISDAVEATT